MDLPQALVPQDVELGVLLLQLPQLPESRVGIAPLRQLQPVGEHRLQHRGLSRRLKAQPLSRPGAAQPCYSADGPRLRLLHGPVFGPGVDPDLVRFFFPAHLPLPAGQGRFHPQAAPGDLQVGQPDPLGVPGDLVHPGPELRGTALPGGILLHPLQELRHPLQLQGGAEPAGKQPAPLHQGPDLLRLHLPPLQISLQRSLVAHGHALLEPGSLLAEVHAAAVQPLELCHQNRPVRPRQVHLVDKEEGGDVIALQQPPQGPGVPLHPVRPADDQDGAVQHLESTLHLAGEVHMARGVQQGDLYTGQRQHRLLGKNGDAPLPLQRLRVQKGVLVVHPPQPLQCAAGVQHPLG